MIKFLVDSASDYSFEEAKTCDLEFVPLKVKIDNIEYQSGMNLSSDQFYELLIKTNEFPKTSQPSPQQFVEVFEKAKANHDELICVLLSSGLSGTYQSATLAKEIVDYDGIYLVDSLAATHMIRMSVEYGQKLVKQGLSAEQITEELNNFKNRVRVFATLDTLEYLYKGGRLSRMQATIGEIANIKPVVSVNESGEVYVKAKNLGINKSISYLVNLYKTSQIDENFPIYSVYTYGQDNVEKLEKKFSDQGLRFDERKQVGSTIGAHVGPNAFGFMFVQK